MKQFHTGIPRRLHRNLAHLLGALAASAVFVSAHLAQAATDPSETYRCLESAKNKFSVGVALTQEAAQDVSEAVGSLGAVTLIRPEDEDTEANFTIRGIKRKKDRIELELQPVSDSAEATGLRKLKIRPSGRAESEAEIGAGAITLSCSRQFLK